MKVAFCGASGTGKTTLMRLVCKYMDIPTNPVGSRSVSKAMGFKSPYDVDTASLKVYQETLDQYGPEEAARFAMSDWDGRLDDTVRALFQRNLQSAKIEWETAHDRFVTDRTTADDLCYTTLHAHHTLDVQFIDRAINHLNTYDVVFLCPVSAFIDTGNDPSRLHDLAYHIMFEKMIVGIVATRKASTYMVNQSDLCSRIARVLSCIESSRPL